MLSSVLGGYGWPSALLTSTINVDSLKVPDQLLPINKFSVWVFLFESARPIRKGLPGPFHILISVIRILIVYRDFSLDDRARQQSLKLQCNVLAVTGFIRHTIHMCIVCLTKPVD